MADMACIRGIMLPPECEHLLSPRNSYYCAGILELYLNVNAHDSLCVTMLLGRVNVWGANVGISRETEQYSPTVHYGRA